MRVLILRERQNGDVPISPHFVPENEAGRSERIERPVEVLIRTLLVREKQCLYTARSVLYTAFPVREAPEPRKGQAGERGKFGELLVREKGWVQDALSHLYPRHSYRSAHRVTFCASPNRRRHFR